MTQPAQLPVSPKPTHVAIPLHILPHIQQALSNSPASVAGRALVLMQDAGAMDVLVRGEDGTYTKHKGD